MQQQTFSFEPLAPASPARRNVVIEAGAGTGKTTAIVAEVLKLLLEHEDLDPQRIVLMTFTEKAAGEIADRIRVALQELAERAPDDGVLHWPIGSATPLVAIDESARVRRAIEHHLANIDALRSQTIHSFCQSILRSFPIEAGLDPQFKIVQGFERALLYGQLYDAWLDHETRVDPIDDVLREWELLFTHAGYLFVIRELVLALIERRDLLAETGYDFGDFERDVLPTLHQTVTWIRDARVECKDPAAMRVATYIRETTFDSGSIDEWIEFFQPIASSIREVKLPGCGGLKEPMKELRGDTNDSVYDRLVSHRAGLALLALTRRFVAWLDAEKRKLGVVDFDDLLLRTLAVLDDPEVLARARAQFDFIFVDEFQDTDRTQARIIDRLARDASGAYVPGKTIVVGDPKQSIYGFRRADPETYYQMTEALVREGAEPRVIGDQYRSDPPMVDAVNAIFARLFPDLAHDPNVFRPAYKPLRAARTELRRELDARITLLHAQHAGKSERYFAQAEAIAEWIQKNRDRGPNDLQRFAILFRRLTVLDDYLDTFRRYGIDFVLPPTRLFLDRRAPVDLLAVLRAIAWPFDLGAQISAARSPYFALTDIEIAEGCRENPGEAGAAWQTFTESIARFRDASKQLTVSGLIDLVIETCGIESVYAAMVDDERNLSHLEHVRAIAFEYDTREGGSVRQFVEEIARRRGEPEETEPSLIDESQNAVRIMSVHAAKGLEFETVILPDLSFQPGGSETLQLFTVEEPRHLVLTGRVVSISANLAPADPKEPLKKISKAREDAESLRLFYVAVTRAKTDVVFVVNPEDRKTGFHKALLSVVGELAWSERGREVRDTPIGPVAFEKMESRGRDAGERTRQRLRDASLEAELSGPDLVPWTSIAPSSPDEILGGPEIAARRAGSRNRSAGILLHRVLELWDGAANADALLTQLASEAAADADAVLKVRRRLQTIARSSTHQRILAAETLGREVPVRFLENGTPVERRIDRLIRENDRDIVVDYKSGAAEASRVSRDRLQVARYAEAIRTITGRPCSALLWYIDLEHDEVVEVGGGR